MGHFHQVTSKTGSPVDAFFSASLLSARKQESLLNSITSQRCISTLPFLCPATVSSLSTYSILLIISPSRFKALRVELQLQQTPTALAESGHNEWHEWEIRGVVWEGNRTRGVGEPMTKWRKCCEPVLDKSVVQTWKICYCLWKNKTNVV